MQEELKGKGILRRIDLEPAEWAVEYHFSIVTTLLRKPGFPPVAARADGRGTVSAQDRSRIPEGHYQLTIEGGEILRVKNLGLAQWVILSPAV